VLDEYDEDNEDEEEDNDGMLPTTSHHNQSVSGTS
jgi:hypothetical protein